MDETWNSSDKFNREAAQWDENKGRRALAHAVAEAIIAAAKPHNGMLALEFGCGTGLITMEIAPHAGTVLAVDTSSAMLAVLDEKIRTSGVTSIVTTSIDISSQQFTDSHELSFDLIYSSMTLHHISDTAAFLNQLSTLLAPGGMIAIADLDREDGLFHDDPLEKLHHGFERSELAAMIEAAGLQKTTFETAYIFDKQNREGKMTAYPVFLVTAQKPVS
jgi:ubiquinone/menaquinone biosynthesis C-methylase UbiE